MASLGVTAGPSWQYHPAAEVFPRVWLTVRSVGAVSPPHALGRLRSGLFPCRGCFEAGSASAFRPAAPRQGSRRAADHSLQEETSGRASEWIDDFLNAAVPSCRLQGPCLCYGAGQPHPPLISARAPCPSYCRAEARSFLGMSPGPECFGPFTMLRPEVLNCSLAHAPPGELFEESVKEARPVLASDPIAQASTSRDSVAGVVLPRGLS